MACFTDTSRIFNHDITFLLIIIGLYFLLSPNIANEDRPRKISMLLFALTVAPFLGFYDGFFGPGTGSLIALAFILLCGYSATRATANAKILNFTSNFAALLYFIIFGQIDWTIGLIMMLGQIIGSYIGAKMVLTKGTSLIRPIVVIVCFVMAIKIFTKYKLNVINILFGSKLECFQVLIAVLRCLRCVQNYTI